MGTQLNIVTAADLRAFIAGQLDLSRQADVIGALADDDRAQALAIREVRAARQNRAARKS